MLYSIENVEDLELSNELVSLESQVEAVRLQGKLDKQKFHEDMKKVFEPVTKFIKDISEEITENMTENSNENNKTKENLNNKRPEIMNDRGILASCLTFLLSKSINPEDTSHVKLVKDPSLKRVNSLLIENSIPINLHDNLLTFRDTGKVFELKGELLKMIVNKNYNVGLASSADKRLLYDFAKEMHFDITGIGNKSTGEHL